MEFKEVIRALECYRNRHLEANPFIIHPELMDKAINLLQEGEKYKAMWEKARDKIQSGWFNEIEQEYFPPIKRIITIEVESKNEDRLNLLLKYIKDYDINMKINIEGDTIDD